jgi:hypothetical protein
MNQFVEFTRRGPTTYGGMALHVSQIKAVEQARENRSRILLWEKMDGWDYYWAEEPYTVMRDRLAAAQGARQ